MRFKQHNLAAFFVALIIVGFQVFSKPAVTPRSDEFIYLSITSDLISQKTFSDGPFSKDPEKTTPGRFFAPLYPNFLSLIAGLDENASKIIQCYGKRDKQKSCEGSFFTVVFVQTLLAAVSLWFIFAVAHLLSGYFLVAWMAMIIAVATGEFGYYARHYLSENAAFFSFYGLLFCLVCAYLKDKSSYFLVAGLFAGLAVLSRPSYAYLFYILIPFLLVLLIAIKHISFKRAAGLVGAFALGGFVLLAPWMFRNFVQFGDVALTQGYGQFILFQRLAYNLMSWPEWGVFFIQGLPDFGDNLSKALFSQNLWERLTYKMEGVETFYNIGNSSVWQAGLLPDNVRDDQQVAYLIKTYILGDFFKHVMVSIPLSLRGMWAGKYLALLAVVLVWPVGEMMRRKELLTPFLLLALPPLFMVGLHGFVSVNVIRYNVPMIAVYAVICALFIRHLLELLPLTARFSSWFDRTN